MNAISNEWMDDGLCRKMPPKYWYPTGTPTEQKRLTQAGVAICQKCPVREQCFAYALAEEPYGTWGGFDETAREVYRSEQGLPLLMTAKDRQRNAQLRQL